MAEFLSMGGYGAYVWPSYGLSAVIMLVLLIASLRSLKSPHTNMEGAYFCAVCDLSECLHFSFSSCKRTD